MKKHHYLSVALLAAIIVIVGLVMQDKTAQATIYIGAPYSCQQSTWSLCQNAFTSNNQRTSGVLGASGLWKPYGIINPGGSPTITKVEVGVEGISKQTKPTGCQRTNMTVAVSKNGGSSFGPDHALFLDCTEKTTWLDVTGDFGVPWTFNDLATPSYAVRAKCTTGIACQVDFIPTRITTL